MSVFGVTRQICCTLRPLAQTSVKAPTSSKSQAILLLEQRNIKLVHTTSMLKSEKEAEVPEDSPEVKELKQINADLTTSVEDWKSKHDEILDKYRRAIAESENMRKRLTKQIEDGKIFGIQSFSKDLLEVADVLDKAVSVEGQSAQDLHKGLEMTKAQLHQVFKRHGLEKINPKEGEEKFDPNMHDALFQIPVPDKDPNIVMVVQKVGYSLQSRTIRPASVGVSRK